MNRATHTPAALLATEPQATNASTAPALALPSQPEEVEPFTLELEFPDDEQAALSVALSAELIDELQAAADLFTQDAKRAAGLELAVSMPAASAQRLADLLTRAAVALANANHLTGA